MNLRLIFIAALVLLSSLTAFGNTLNREIAQPAAQDLSRIPDTQLKIDDIETVGRRTNPHAMKVSWTFRSARKVTIEGYEITLELNNGEVSGRVFQTPSANVTSVSVGLLSIPNETRAKLFDPNSKTSAKVVLKAKIIRDGRRETIEATFTETLSVTNPPAQPIVRP